jgi:4,5-DOPA dioxygenase extradiol
MNTPNFGFDWAFTINAKFKQLIAEGNHNALIHYQQLGKEALLAIPTPEHFLPLLYSLALQNNTDVVSFFNDQAVAGSLTMTSVKIAS